IQHSFVDVRGLRIHIAEIGTGPAVVFVHGFPEIWYSWRYQMMAASAAGFRAIAPDLRGYGLSEQPPDPEKTAFKDFADDLLVLLDEFNLRRISLVGKDFGARIVYHFALLHPERLSAVATVGSPFRPPEAAATFSSNSMCDDLPKGLYIFRWQASRRAEKDFARFDVTTVIKNIYILFSGRDLPAAASEDQEIMDLVDPSTPLPSWFTQRDLAHYSSHYLKSGFQTALQVPYRALSEGYDGVDEMKIKVPGLLIMGEKDYSMKFPGIEDYVRTGGVEKYFVSGLEVHLLPDGTHFSQEQFPDRVNHLLLAFLSKH
ncbi:epoxide hydrolase, partial [Genlisea aurea]